MDSSVISLLVVLAVVVFIVIKIYNKLVSFKTQYENSYAQIDVQLKRRLDLIPNLVEVAKKYMEHERETLTKVTEAREGMSTAMRAAKSKPGDAGVMTALAQSEVALSGAMSGFNLKMESYPDLKASENMMQLTEEMTTTENKVAYSRQGYNDLVQKFNEYRNSFPTIMLAGMFGFPSDAALLQFAETKEELNKAPKVSF